jgi:hypothetical protein
VISVRGSSESKDFYINAQLDGIDFEYHAGSVPGNVVSGKVHAGMIRGAKAILDDYGLRYAVQRLAADGYCIKVAGHSLGGGTSALIAAELKNGFMDQLRSNSITSLPRIVAYCYACPCVASADLAAAMAVDELVFCLVNKDDPVPRSNHKTVLRLLKRIREFRESGKFRQWQDQDNADGWNYALTLGAVSKGASMHETKDEPQATESKAVSKLFRSFSEDGTPEDADNAKRLLHMFGEPLFVPGQVVCMYLGPEGTMQATLGDYRMATFQRISRCLPEETLTHHTIGDYLSSLRGLRALNNFQPRAGVAVSRAASTNVLTVKNCTVCGLNPTWPFKKKGDSERSVVSYICGICNGICCTVCAPAADKIPGDGFDVVETLDDYRIPLPSKGLLAPQRVCHPCYFSSYTA